MGNFINITGHRFGKLVAVKQVENISGRVAWLLDCDCGGTKITTTQRLRKGKTKSCGCVVTNTTHGFSNTDVYRRWAGFLQRCTNPSNPAFHNYGGRGITVCERWESFENFYADMGDPPPGKTLDRIDNDGPYSPENCRWASRKRQQRNRRDLSLITFNDKTQCMAEWAEELGMKRDTLRQRFRNGWSIEKAMTTPVDKSKSFKTRTVTINGVSKTVQEWSDHSGIKTGTLYHRMRKGWPTEHLLSPLSKNQRDKPF